MSYTLQTLSSDVFVNEFDSDSDVITQVKISGWFGANIGQLNSQIHTSFDSDLSSDKEGFGHEEAAIFTLMYMKNYYSKASRKTLLGQDVGETSTTTSITGMSEWTRIQEGDTVIERQPLYTSSSNATSKTSQDYKDLLDSTKDDLDDMIAKYNLYSSEPRQVFGLDGE